MRDDCVKGGMAERKHRVEYRETELANSNIISSVLITFSLLSPNLDTFNMVLLRSF